jgi:hypothetical protein
MNLRWWFLERSHDPMIDQRHLMFKKCAPFGLFIFFSMLQTVTHAWSGPHNGQIAKMVPHNNSLLLPGYSIELVNLSKLGSTEKVFRIYVLQPDSQPVNIMGSGYWKVSWRVGNKQGQLQDNLEEEKRKTWKEKPSYTPLYSFVAKGNILKDRNLEIEVVIALPSKGGTGMAVFYPFKTASRYV